MRFEFPGNVQNNFEGYRSLIELFNAVDGCVFDEIILDFDKTTWFEANLTAVLGAVLSKAQSEVNTVRIENLHNNVDDILSRNHFLSHFGGREIFDLFSSTIKYRRFRITEEKLFKEYLDRELLSKEALPSMSTLLRKKINESIFEIFNNAVIHGSCGNIFSCGQYYPKRKRLDFTIVDLGITIKVNVNKYLGKNYSGSRAIQWAVSEGHTTKQSQIPGGLGLSLIREFLEKNNGKIQIISADGYWEQAGTEKVVENFSQEFQGTIVNLEFNVEDKGHYCLSSEIKEDEIF